MGMPFSHLEERVYDFRCVEAWSMVIPYNGRPTKRYYQGGGTHGVCALCGIHQRVSAG